MKHARSDESIFIESFPISFTPQNRENETEVKSGILYKSSTRAVKIN